MEHLTEAASPKAEMRRTLLPSEIPSRSTSKLKKHLTFDSGRPGAVVEDGQLPKDFAGSHGAQLHTFLCHFNLPLCRKEKRKPQIRLLKGTLNSFRLKF